MSNAAQFMNMNLRKISLNIIIRIISQNKPRGTKLLNWNKNENNLKGEISTYAKYYWQLIKQLFTLKLKYIIT